MDNVSAVDIFLGIGYLTGALSLCVVAYLIYLKRFKTAKLQAENNVSLITSRDNVFCNKTQFLVVSPSVSFVKIDLLDENEEYIETLIEQDIVDGEFPFNFDPSSYDSGKYYLYLDAGSSKILRAITIAK